MSEHGVGSSSGGTALTGGAASATARTSTATGAAAVSATTAISRRMRVFLNDPEKNDLFEYPDNSIQTSRYTLLTFLPLFLQQQYKKASNIFLLVVCILTFIPGVSALGPAASLFPVIFVLVVAGLKEGYEDYKRHKADDLANSIEVKVLRNGDWLRIPSRDVRAGDIALYEHGDEIRADSIVLASSNDDGVAFIETANLDGETTLKIRRAPAICMKYFLNGEEDILKVTAEHGVAILAAEPNPDLQKFRAAIHIGGPECSPAPLDESEVQQMNNTINNNSGSRSRGDNKKKRAGSIPASVSSQHSQDSSSNVNKKEATHNSNNENTNENNTSAVEKEQQEQQHASHKSIAKLGVDIKCFLYRGSKLRNTEWTLCATVYTGINTKLFLNLQQSAPRLSDLDVAVNQMIFSLLILHQIAIFVLSGMAVAWTQDNQQAASFDSSAGERGMWYFRSSAVTGSDLGTVFGLRYLGYFVLLSFVLPASLFVTIEVAKAIQAVFMSWDHGMATYHVASGQWLFCRPKTSTLNEQLGLVRYVFTDKTGTLTQNQMNVVRICFDDTVLDDETGAVGKTVAQHVGRAEDEILALIARGELELPPPPAESSVLGDDLRQLQIQSLARMMVCSDSISNKSDNDNGSQQQHQEPDALHLLLLNMAVCHSVVCFDNKTHPLLKTYEGPSQDELALTASARRNGYALMDRKTNGVEVNLPGQQVTLLFELIAELEFTSDRQMMSVLVKDAIHDAAALPAGGKRPHEPRYILFSKGGDNAIFTRCALADHIHNLIVATEAQVQTNKRRHRSILAQLDQLCATGLRTLVFAYRIITEREMKQWLAKFETARCAIENRSELVAAACSQIEHSLNLIGVVGIEDKLQDAVPETLHFLKQAGITIWMLTGDKRETAVAIAETSNLISLANPKDLVMHINLVALVEDDETTIEQVTEAALMQMAAVEEQLSDINNAGRALVLVVDGISLKAALHANEEKFMRLALQAKSAVCCRLSPLLKAQLVRLFQAATSETVLAIGDGANDVSMIQASMVGIGIMGLEGSQAELSSAYALPQFKDLKRLLVVHGRYAWYRTTTCMNYTIFKNAALTLCLFYFSFFSAFSGATLYDSWLLTMFNTFFTQATPLLIGGIDTDVDDKILMQCPDLYKFLRIDREYFNMRAFFFWFCDAVVTSVVVFWLGYSMMAADDMGRGDPSSSYGTVVEASITGMSLDHYGTVSFLVLLVIVDAYALVTQQIYSTVSGVIVFLNWCLIPVIMFIYSLIPVDSSFNFTNLPEEVLSDRLFYLFMWVAVALVVLCLRVAARRLIREIWPSPSEAAIRRRVAEFKRIADQEEEAAAEVVSGQQAKEQQRE